MTNSQQIYSVSSLNQQIKNLLEHNFVSLLVEAEISNLIKASSGHWYFSLKDQDSQVRCAMFKGANRFVKFNPENGSQVLVRANVSLYKPRGEYQLIVESMEPAGTGRLQQAFNDLKKRLAAEGLFAQETKQPLPDSINKIGIITSPKGAAIHDMLSIMARLAPNIEVIIYPCLVQGVSAAAEISRMIELANLNEQLDLLVVGRGGGSTEDLWAFNEEQLAYTIHYSRLPVISAVGHETDLSIADFVADIRAATPSAAAEIISQQSIKLKNQLPNTAHKLKQSIQYQLGLKQNQLNRLELKLSQQDPHKQLISQQQWFDEQLWSLQHALTHKIAQSKNTLNQLENKLNKNHPRYLQQQLIKQQNQLAQRLVQAMQQTINTNLHKHALLVSKLQAYSPLATFDRGFSATYNQQGKLIKSHAELKTNELIKTQFKDGQVWSKVVSTENEVS